MRYVRTIPSAVCVHEESYQKLHALGAGILARASKATNLTPPVSGGPQQKKQETAKKRALWAVRSTGLLGAVPTTGL